MNDLLTRLFSLRTLQPGETGVTLEWAHPAPAWGWMLIVLAATFISWWGYHRLEGKLYRRTILAILRGISLLIVALMISGPRLVKTEETIERDWVVVLADRSQSMDVRDVAGKAREEQLRTALDAARPLLEKLEPQKNILWLGFDSRAYDLPSEATALGPPTGSRTLVAGAIEQSLRRVASKPVSGIVLLSDGRSADEASRSLLRQLQSRQIPVFTVPLGSETPPARVIVKRVSAPSVAFVGDFVPITVDLDAIGLPSSVGGIKIDLIDEATGRVLDSKPVPTDPTSTESSDAKSATTSTSTSRTITLLTRPGTAQESKWIVRPVLPDSGESTASADDFSIRLRVIDRPIRVALFDGYPRWEYRYLKNLLLRERSIRSSALVLSSDRRYLQEGTDPLASIPRTPEEWQPFDVIVMGDVRSELFSTEQLQQIRDLVSNKGAGILWIAGPNATPQTWRGTPLADLLPFTLDDTANAPRSFAESVLASPTPSAERLGVLRLGENASSPWPESLGDSAAGWNAFRFAQLIEPQSLKPAAEVLALATPSSNPSGSASARPLVVTMRYGAGRVIYVGTDEIWRWRYGRGETLPERFWLPLVRLLARESLARSGQSAIIDVSPERALVDQPVQVSVRLLDQSLLGSRPESLAVRVRSADPAAPEEQTIVLRPQTESRAGSQEGTGLYSASWIFSEAGDYTVRPIDAMLAGLGISAKVEVRDRDDELRESAADHAVLASLSDSTGGRVIQVADLKQLPTLLPNRQVRTAGATLSESLWDKPIVWSVLITLLCLEWIARRLLRLA